ncbi:DivIVA domain-containing protein [Herbidospora sp. RD11066]
MVLTPEDVRTKVFTTGRLREGYDLAEVDVFLNEVESSLRWLHQENERLAAMVTVDPAKVMAAAESRERRAEELLRAAAELLGEVGAGLDHQATRVNELIREVATFTA